MRIGELSRSTGCGTHQLRYYEAQGLLRSHRGANGYRKYGPEAVSVVRSITGSLAIGLSTREIAMIDELTDGEGSEAVLTIVRARLAKADEQLETLRRAHRSLQDCVNELELQVLGLRGTREAPHAQP